MAYDDDFTAFKQVPELIGSRRRLLGGRYQLGEVLGCGSFAKVYQARDIRTHQTVAIKCISKKQVVSAGLAASQIKREISVMGRLRHPNIVKLHHVMATKTKIYLVMDFEEGGTLYDKLTKGRRFSEDVSRKYFRQLISAVGYCHAQGVFHRDLKPDNLLLDRNSNLKVSDFGLSAVKEQMGSDGLLHTQCGTLDYVAPELLGVKAGYDGAKVDVWSCGVILYVFTIGYLPFTHQNMAVLHYKIKNARFTFPYNRKTSPDLRRFLRRLLDPNPATRITVLEIISDPWFTKGSDQQQFKFVSDVVNSDDVVVKERDVTKCMNAFDICASFSSGMDLSPLFIHGAGEFSVAERFVSQYLPEKIRETIETVAISEGLVVTRRRDWGVKLEDLSVSLLIEIDRLTSNLVVVIVRQRQAAAAGAQFLQVWNTQIRPKLDNLVYQNKILNNPTRSF